MRGLEFIVNGTSLSVALDGIQVISVEDTNPLPAGQIQIRQMFTSLQTSPVPEHLAVFDNFSVQPPIVPEPLAFAAQAQILSTSVSGLPTFDPFLLFCTDVARRNDTHIVAYQSDTFLKLSVDKFEVTANGSLDPSSKFNRLIIDTPGPFLNTTINQHNVLHPAISPDGNEVVYVEFYRHDNNSTLFSSWGLFVVNVNDCSTRNILPVSDQPLQQPTWSPDGSQIAAVAVFSNAISRFDANTRNQLTSLFPPNVHQFFNDVAWSPNSQYMIYTESDNSSLLTQFNIDNVNDRSRVSSQFGDSDYDPDYQYPDWWGPGSVVPPTPTPTFTPTPTVTPTLEPPVCGEIIANSPSPQGHQLFTTTNKDECVTDEEIDDNSQLESLIEDCDNGETLNGTFSPTSATYDISQTLLIKTGCTVNLDGSNGAVIIQPGDSGQFRIFEVQAGATLTLTNITIQNGYSNENGGAILNDGDLILNNSILENNRAELRGGGIYNNGTLTVITSRLQYNVAIGLNSSKTSEGGAIYSTASSTGTINDNCITYNTARKGGGIFSESSTPININGNWWGNPDGPTISGFKDGDVIEGNFEFTTVRNAPIDSLNCLDYSSVYFNSPDAQVGQPGFAGEVYLRAEQILGTEPIIDDILAFILSDAARFYIFRSNDSQSNYGSRSAKILLVRV